MSDTDRHGSLPASFAVEGKGLANAMSEALLREALQLHQAGNLAEAARLYGEVVRANPRHFGALYLLAFAHIQSRRFEEAERLLGQAIVINPNSTEALLMHASVLRQLDRKMEALSSYDAALAIEPAHLTAWNDRGNVLLALNREADALCSYDRALVLKPDYPEAWHNRAVALIMLARFDDALVDLEKALAFNPHYTEAFEHRGLTLAILNRHQEALESYDAAIGLRPDDADLLCNRGNLFLKLDRLKEALSDYDRALSTAKDKADAWHNRGVALSKLGCPRDALASYDMALSIRPDFPEAWCNRGNTLLEMNDRAGALLNYDKALAIRPDYAMAWRGRGVALMAQQLYADALTDFERALSIEPDSAETWEQRGNALSRLNYHAEALECYDKTLAIRSDNADVLYNRANILAAIKRFEDAIRDCERLLVLAPDYPYARGLLLRCRLECCDWRFLEGERAQIAADLSKGKRVIHPFGQLAISRSPEDELRCARIEVEALYPPSPAHRGENYRHDKIRIAYLSADFHSHATAFLMAGVFENHAREQFEIVAVSFGPDDKSAMRTRLESAFDRFIDVRDNTDSHVAALMRQMEIDIAVDLKGFTDGCRPGILALRPAPIQLSYLGYPGTMGAPYIDYIVADRTVIPDEHRAYYTERIVYLPDSYQCNDGKRRIAERAPSRAEASLPETGFVFCCFNSIHKIAPETFDIWCRLLKHASGSVLWLLGANTAAVRNLRREAEARGIAAGRLVFADFKNLDEHLARLRLADLFLDTLPYCGHTTASDALWVGLPVLTMTGPTFAGRVAASLLSAIGLPELAAASPNAYEAIALELARDESALAAIKAKLARNRDTHALFDTRRFTRNLETAYIEMWSRHRRGDLPSGFAVELPPP